MQNAPVVPSPAREIPSAVVVTSPGREVETAAALPPAADPLIQNSLARPEQPIAESRPTEAAPSAAPARVLPPRESPAPAATAFNPRSETPRPLPQQAASELKPFDVAQAAAPVQTVPTARDTAPTARETPPAEAAPLAPQLAPALAPSESIEARTVPVNIAADDPAAVAASKYRDVVYAELNRHKRYPEAARQARITGAVLAAFTIGTNGQVSAITITRSSGHASLDGAVRQLLGALALPPPPAGPIRVAVPVEFKFGGF
jgi:protein TonB